MKYRNLLYLLIVISLPACTKQSPDILTSVAELQERGEFSAAENRIATFLSEHPDLNSTMVRNLRFEIERGRRIRLDYRLSEDVVYERIRARLDSVSREEFDRWQDQGRFDTLRIDGEKRFVNPSVSNLLFRYPELRSRLKNYDPESNLARIVDKHVKRLQQLAADDPDPVLLPRNCMVQQTLTIPAGKVPPGQAVRCWLPYPSVFGTQGDVRFQTSDPSKIWIAAPQSPIRSAYLESPMPQEGDLRFNLVYGYTAYAYYRKIRPEEVQPFGKTDELFRLYTREEYPHEVFSEKMRRLSAEVTGSEQNPYLRGKRIYDWIADNIKYSYAREYSTLHNISDYCLTGKYGDCGQEAILFITLCRIAGVPARWQSGFMTFPGDEGMHDWAEIYIKPYGWLPVDPYMGIFFTSMTEDLDPERRKTLRDFYYGNIDHFRLVANKGHNQALYPDKKYFRSETVDFQRGEVEWQGGNLYFNEWRWSIEFFNRK